MLSFLVGFRMCGRDYQRLRQQAPGLRLARGKGLRLGTASGSTSVFLYPDTGERSLVPPVRSTAGGAAELAEAENAGFFAFVVNNCSLSWPKSRHHSVPAPQGAAVRLPEELTISRNCWQDAIQDSQNVGGPETTGEVGGP